MRREDGQSTVELALLLPVVALLVATVFQIGLIARDRVIAVHAARAAARSAVVHPDAAGAQSAADEAVGRAGRFRVEVGGDLHPGGLATVTVTGEPTLLPVVGRVLPRVRLRERLTLRVEGG